MWEFIVDHPFLSFFIFIVILVFINNIVAIAGNAYMAKAWAQLAKEENDRLENKKDA